VAGASVAATAIATSTTLRSSANPSVTGERVILTATIGPIPDGGTVRFLANGRTIAGCGAAAVDRTTGMATCNTSYSTPGAREIEAVYSGNSSSAGSHSATLTQTVHWSLILEGPPNGSSGAASSRIRCAPHSGGCQLTAVLSAVERLHAGAVVAVGAGVGQPARMVIVGAKNLTISSGRTLVVTVNLNPRGRELLTRFKSVPVKQTISVMAAGRHVTVAISKLSIRS
jgi:hypothetical protein